MMIKRPAIFIYTYQADPFILKQVCAGMEEEGVFFDITEQGALTACRLALDAANASMLGVGVGIHKDYVSLQMKGQAEGKNISSYYMPMPSKSRTLGTNGARIAKKLPLK